MDAKAAREWVRDGSIPCPNCGGAVVLAFDGSLDTARKVASGLADGSLRFQLQRAEDAEVYLRESATQISFDDGEES